MSTATIPDTTDPRVGTTFEQDDWTVRVSAEPDTHPEHPRDESDGYTDAQIAAWERDDWSYCLLIVTATREGVELGRSVLGGIEFGYFTYTDEDNTVTGHGYAGPYTEAVDDCVAGAIEEARLTLGRLCAGVQS